MDSDSGNKYDSGFVFVKSGEFESGFESRFRPVGFGFGFIAKGLDLDLDSDSRFPDSHFTDLYVFIYIDLAPQR